jgi:transcriptional regulator GlxA family with amidase domain
MLRIGFVLPPGFQMMSLAAVSAFELANVAAGKALYKIQALSEDGGPTPSSLGIGVETRAFGAARFDTLLVSGVLQVVPSSAGLIRFVRSASRRCRRVVSICTGAFILADAGLLDGRRATTHWFYARELQDRFPRAKVDMDRIFVADGPVWTSAGMTAGIDLSLGLIENDFGVELARAVARKLVVYHRRSGGQSQHSALLEMDAKTDRIQGVLTYARQNLRSSLSVEELAGVAHLSPRQFSRVFAAETGQSPAKAMRDWLRRPRANASGVPSRFRATTPGNQTGRSRIERSSGQMRSWIPLASSTSRSRSMGLPSNR